MYPFPPTAQAHSTAPCPTARNVACSRGAHDAAGGRPLQERARGGAWGRPPKPELTEGELTATQGAADAHAPAAGRIAFSSRVLTLLLARRVPH